MRKLALKGGMFAILLSVTVVACKKKDVTTQNQPNSSRNSKEVVINEKNVGEFHNKTIQYIIDDLAKMPKSDAIINAKSAVYLSTKMKEICRLNHIDLPSDDEITRLVRITNTSSQNKSIDGSEPYENDAFDEYQKSILKKSFDVTKQIDVDVKYYDEIMVELNKNLTLLNDYQDSDTNKIAIATVQQLISSTEFWVKDNNYDIMTDILDDGSKAAPPTRSQVLGKDAVVLGTALLFGANFATPIGWAGSMMVAAGASIGVKVNSVWWPY